MAQPDGRRRYDVIPGGGEGPVEDLAFRRRRFEKQLRDEIRFRLNGADEESDRALAARVPDITGIELCEIVIVLRQRSHRELRQLMQPGFGR